MIKFFRKIRQKLLTENKFSKYLIYAIGEIVLVVIGILIALSIDNWNENKKSQLNDVKFLNNLRSEIQLDTLMIRNKMNAFTQYNEILKQTLQLLNRRTEIAENERQTISNAFAYLPILTPIYKNIEKNNAKLADGTLLNINNQLNTKYQEYIEGTKSNTEIINKLGQTLQLVDTHYIHPNVDFDYNGREGPKIQFDIKELRNNRLIKNAINKSISYREVYINMLEGQQAKAIELIDILNKEIN